MAPPFTKACPTLCSALAFAKKEIIDLGAAKEIIDKSGAWYSYNGERIGQGQSVKEFLKANTKMRDEIKAKILASLQSR